MIRDRVLIPLWVLLAAGSFLVLRYLAHGLDLSNLNCLCN